MAKLLEVKRVKTDGRLYANFEAKFDGAPTKEEVSTAQIEAGYHPAGYGGPWQVKTTVAPNGDFITTWNSSGSCD